MRLRFLSGLFFALFSNGVFAQPAANPDLQISCPYDIIFVLDESGSIAGVGASNITAVVRNAAINLMNSLSGSGSQVAVIEFNSAARRANIGGTTNYQVVDATYITAFTAYMNDPAGNTTASANNYDPEDYSTTQYYTNWEAAFIEIQNINNGTPPIGGFAELIIFFTDGEPNAIINAQGQVQNNVATATALSEAVGAANAVKAQGSHIFVVGLPNTVLSETNVQQISGPDRYPDLELSFIRGDYSVSTSESLEDDLARIAASVCKIDLDLVKTVNDVTPCSGDTAVFTLTLSNDGLDNASLIVVTDTIPSGFSYLSDNGGSTTTFSGGVVTWSLDSLNAGESIAIQITATVNNSGDYTNITQVTSYVGDDIDSTNNQDTLVVTLLLNCDDGDACTVDFCENGLCVNQDTCCVLNLDCDDGDLCTVDTCQTRACISIPVDCDDGDACTNDSCDDGDCLNLDITPCNIRFPCTGSFFLSQYDNGSPPTTLYDVVVNNNVTFSPLTIYGLEINAIGFNPNDNFIYGIEQNTLNVIRMFSDGTYQDLGQPANLPITAYIAADFDSNGNFVITGGAADVIVTIDVSGSPISIVNTISLFYNPPSPGSNLNVADIAFHPATGKCYGFDFGTNRLVEINTTSGEVTLISSTSFPNSNSGALFFKPNGDLYGYGFDSLYTLNIQTGIIQSVTSGPAAGARDGCSCPFSVDMFKEVFPNRVCLGDTVTYRISINNQTQGELDSITLADLLDGNLTISTLPNNLFGGTVTAGTGLGTNSLVISGMTIPNDTIVFEFRAVVSTNYSGGDTLFNQARITGLPAIYGDSVLSDDPSTVAFDDSTGLIVTTDCDDEDACTKDFCENGLCIHTPIECNDNNACTADRCNSQTGCVTTPVVCNDGNACTTDGCDSLTGCTIMPVICNDANACTTDDCNPQTGCTTTDVICNDSNACTTDGCDPQTGCTTTNIVCNDGNACTTDGCNPSTGCTTTAVVCNDGSACTTDGCNPSTGCTTTGVVCNDGNACTTDGCEPQTGCTTTAVVCNDNNACTTDGCDPQTGCTTTPVICTDGNVCNGIETCDPVLGCQPGTPLVCSDNNVCNGIETCDPVLGCQPGTPLVCSDNNVCNGIETCDPVLGCQVGTPLVCSDNNVCNGIETCDPVLGCQAGTPLICTDGDVCNGIETCDPLLGCQPATSLVCSDNNLCNGIETCDSVLGCQVGTPLVCTDGNVCNGVETCDPILGCQQGTPLICNDGDVCTMDSCNTITGCVTTRITCNDSDPCTIDNCASPSVGCTFTPLNCGDGNLCTVDTCISGVCSNPPLDCDDDSLCTRDFCVAGVCMHVAISNCCVDVDDCNEGGVCSVEACIGNVCYYADVCCDDGDGCTWDYCENGDCIFVPKFCEDNNPCTDNACINDHCSFPPLTCDDNDLCTTDACISGNCIHAQVVCNDGDPCTTDFCDNGCQSVPIPCSDGDRCTTDSCIQGTCISYEINCNDNNVCTNDTCVNGDCRYTPVEISVIMSKTDVTCGYASPGAPYVLNFAGLPHGTILNEQFANQGIHISAQAYPNGNTNAPNISQLVIYDTHIASSNFDLQAGIGNIAIFPTNVTDNNNDSRVDNPDDTKWGGRQIFSFDWDRTVCSFLVVDIHKTGGVITAYDQFDNVLLSIPLPVAPYSYPLPEIVTVNLNVSGVRKLVIDYKDEGGITDIVLDCQSCDGTAQALPTGGTAPYNYHWSSGETAPSVQHLCQGNHCMTVTDALGCFAVQCVDIEVETVICDDGDPCTEDRCISGICSFIPVEINLSVSAKDVCNCISAGLNQICRLDYSGLPHGTFLDEQYASAGIHVSAIANYPGKSNAVIFNTFATGTPDPDLQVDIGNIVIIPFNTTDINPVDGLVDNPNDNTTGGKMIFSFDSPRTIESFVFVDEEDNHGTGKAYDSNGNLIISVPILQLGNASVQTVVMHASGVKQLVIEYRESGGVGEIIFGDCNTSCCDGTAAVVASGGEPPYSYHWDTSDDTSSLANLCEGRYCVTVTDNNGCEEVTCLYVRKDNSPGCSARGSKLSNGDQDGYSSEAANGGVALNAYPNPFSDRLNIEFQLSEDSRVMLEMFNVSGQQVATLFDGYVRASERHLLEFNPDNLAGGLMIIYRLKTKQGIYYGKAVMVKSGLGDR